MGSTDEREGYVGLSTDPTTNREPSPNHKEVDHFRLCRRSLSLFLFFRGRLCGRRLSPRITRLFRSPPVRAPVPDCASVTGLGVLPDTVPGTYALGLLPTQSHHTDSRTPNRPSSRSVEDPPSRYSPYSQVTRRYPSVDKTRGGVCLLLGVSFDWGRCVGGSG